MFLDLEEYHKEKERLIKERGMTYMDACNQAWRIVVDRGK